jgi:TPR repeat protein
MASFEEKVEALRRLRERREARVQSSQAADNAAATPCTKASAGAKDLDQGELPAVLEHYAGLQDQQSMHGYFNKKEPIATDAAPDEADALYCMGHCFENGLHEWEQDIEKAMRHYKMAADKGSVVAQWRLGHLHEYGHDVDKNYDTAAYWYRLAAKGGNAHAQSSLAVLLEDGSADAIDADEALHWHLAAAAQGNALSQYCAACCLAAGTSSQQDRQDEARVLLEKSAAAGFPLAVEALSRGDMFNSDVIRETCQGAGYDTSEVVDEGESLKDLAACVARQIKHLPDADADAYLDDLFDSLIDPTALSLDELQEMLSGGLASLDVQDGPHAHLSP